MTITADPRLTQEILRQIQELRGHISISIFSGRFYTNNTWNVTLTYTNGSARVETKSSAPDFDEAIQQAWSQMALITKQGIPGAFVPQIEQWYTPIEVESHPEQVDDPKLPEIPF